jgi:RNA-directed DNA polymerase
MNSRMIDAMAAHLNVDEDDLRTRLTNVDGAYSVFQVPKRRGLRRIEAPHPWLKAVQRFLLDQYLSRIRAHPAAHGFCRGRNIFSHACRHAMQQWVVTVDIQDFFPSVTRSMLTRLPRELGLDQDDGDLLLDIVTRKGRLPQGAPTSPHLGNLVLRDLDRWLESLAAKQGWHYSRYADDLVMSGNELPNAMLDELKASTGSAGFRVNPAKCRIMGRNQRQWVTGLVVNEGLKLPREQRRLLRAAAHRMLSGRLQEDTPRLRGQLSFHEFSRRQERALLGAG